MTNAQILDRTAVRGPQKLGPLTPRVGEWEGDGGVDLS